MDRKRRKEKKRKEKSGTGGLRVLTRRHSSSSLPGSRRHRVLLQGIASASDWICQIVTVAASGRIRTFGIWRQERTECTYSNFQARVGKLVFV